MNISEITNNVICKYDIDIKESCFIRHNENYTMKIIDSNDLCYVLRIHKSNNMQTIGQHTYDALLSEMIILKAIRENTSIKTQEPVKKYLWRIRDRIY